MYTLTLHVYMQQLQELHLKWCPPPRGARLEGMPGALPMAETQWLYHPSGWCNTIVPALCPAEHHQLSWCHP